MIEYVLFFMLEVILGLGVGFMNVMKKIYFALFCIAWLILDGIFFTYFHLPTAAIILVTFIGVFLGRFLAELLKKIKRD